MLWSLKLRTGRSPVVFFTALVLGWSLLAFGNVLQAGSSWELQFKDDFEREELGKLWSVRLSSGNTVILKNQEMVIGREGELGRNLILKNSVSLNMDFEGAQRLEYEVMTEATEEPRCYLSNLGALLNWGGDRVEDGYFFRLGSMMNTLGELSLKGSRAKSFKAEIEPGRWHSVSVQRYGNNFEMVIDGVKVLDYQHEGPLPGPIHSGLGFYTYHSMRVRNVRVYTREEEVEVDVPLRSPVIFSYNHPWGSSNLNKYGWNDPWFMDFDRVRLSTANMVDSVSPEAYAPWRGPDRRILARVRQWASPWRDDKANDLIKYWDEALSQEGIDGFAMDEFIGHSVTSELMEAWITAITEIRRRHPDKILAFWAAGIGQRERFGVDHKPLLQALRDHADFVMPEIYYKSSTQTDFATSEAPFPKFREMVEDWEAQAPGITPKVLMGLGTVQNVDWGYDDLPETVDFGEFLAKQVEVCATDPVLRQIAGLALYAPGYLRPETMDRLNEAIIEFYGIEPGAATGHAGDGDQ